MRQLIVKAIMAFGVNTFKNKTPGYTNPDATII